MTSAVRAEQFAIKAVFVLENNYVYRVRYSRGVDVRYVSHLDILKLFDRACRRANLPVAYSAGFNPHPEFVFGMPLPVGVTSEAEYVDIKLYEKISNTDMVRRLNEALPPAVRIIESKHLPDKAPNIMKSVVASKYRVKVDFSQNDCECTDVFSKIACELSANRPLVVMKRTKSGTRETDIRPMIHSIEFVGCENGIAEILIVTAAGNLTNLRPELAITSLCDVCSVKCGIESIHRLELINS